MKKTLLLLALTAASFAAAAQTPAQPGAAATPTAPAGYPDLLAASIREVTQTSDPAALRAGAARFERAATVAPQDWLPRYYQAYALAASTRQGTDVDKTLDQAEAALAQARKLGGDESELLTLQALIDQSRIRVDFMARGQEYAGRSTEAATRARALNPANPRPYLILATNVYYTPEAYGGGAAAAKPLFEQARAKFEAFRPVSALAPDWGRGQLQYQLKSYEAGAAAR